MGTTDLSPKQRLLAAIGGAAVDRPAAGPLAVHFCAALAGVTLEQYTLDAKVLADCVLGYYERFRPDAVWISADTWVTAEAMGAKVAFPSSDQPCGGTGQATVQSAADIDSLPAPDPTARGRQPLMLEATRRVSEAIGGEAAVVACFDQYPFSLACALMGLNELMVALIDDPAMVHALMERCTEHAQAYAESLAASGADVLSGGDSPAGLIGPKLYKQHALPFEQRLIDRLHETVEQPVSLHICGDATPILEEMSASGADVLELDQRVDVEVACSRIPSDIAIWGNLDPVGILEKGSPSEVEDTTRFLLESFRRLDRRRFVVSSGCTLAVDTPAENLDAMFRTVRHYN